MMSRHFRESERDVLSAEPRLTWTKRTLQMVVKREQRISYCINY